MLIGSNRLNGNRASAKSKIPTVAAATGRRNHTEIAINAVAKEQQLADACLLILTAIRYMMRIKKYFVRCGCCYRQMTVIAVVHTCVCLATFPSYSLLIRLCMCVFSAVVVFFICYSVELETIKS